MIVSIRIPKINDIHSIAKHANDPDVCKFMTDFSYPYDKNKGIEFLKNSIDSFTLGISYNFIIEYLGKPIGMIGGENKDGNSIEIGYRLGKKYWGRGIMQKAIMEFINFVNKELPNKRFIFAKCEINNIRSIYLLKKNGFIKIKQKGKKIYFIYPLNKG